MPWVWVAVLGIIGFPAAQSEGTYSVVAPRVVRPNRDYVVVASTHGTMGPVHMTVEVGGIQDAGGQQLLNRQILEIQQDATQTIKFQIGDLGPGQYNLTVSGYGALSFSNTTALEYVHKSYSVFIQTDKAIYKPGDMMQFRVIVTNPQLRPSVTGAIDIYVADGAGNRVKQWKRVFTNKGVWSGELQLSDEPVLGQWNITVDVLGQMTSQSIEVAYYVLPKFEVIVGLPDYVTFDQEDISATINAKYTHGRPVQGEVTVQVTPTYKYGYLQAPYDDPIREVRGIKGKTDVTFNIKRDLRLEDDYARELEFTAYVREELTGRVQNASAKVTVYRYPYRLNLIRTSDSFKPGLKYTAFLKVSFQDDSPVRSGEVVVRHAFSHNQKDFVETTHTIPRTGIIQLDFLPPLDDEVQNLALEAQYKDLTQWLGDITRAQSPSNAFLQATLLTAEPKVGEEVKVSLNATQPLVYFVYEVMGRGNVVFAQTLQAHKGTTHVFRFIATSPMAPQARLVVYYVKDDGEIVADSLHFAVAGAIQNQVSVALTPREVDAGGEVSITLTTKPNSYVGVLAIDQRSLLLGGTNDITENQLLSELEHYDPGRRNIEGPWHSLNRQKRALFNWHGTTTSGDVFKNAGVVVMTNGLVYDFNPYPDSATEHPAHRPAAVNGPFGRSFAPVDASTLRPDLGPGLAYDIPNRPPLAGPYAFSFLPPPPDSKPRLYLNQHVPDTWLFKDTETRFNGVVTLREKAPDSITSYMISAFAINDFDGLGVSPGPTKLNVFRPFFVSVNLPATGVTRGEAVSIEVIVFNYRDDKITASVTLFNNGDFLFADFANEIDQGSPASSKSRAVVIEPMDAVALSFMVIPQTLGLNDIKVSATAGVYADTISKKLRVKPEGSQVTVNKAMVVDLRNTNSFSETVNITVPPNHVNDSLGISVSVIGDILGTAVQNLGDLLILPTGCGEQNMAKLVPNIVLTEYLKEKDQLSESLLGRAYLNMETGYQNQLNYRHKDGSFSAFGSRDSSGSVWLTAFVAKSLHMASRHIDVEDSVIEEAIEWLADKQNPDGSFKEVGEVNQVALQGGARDGVPLTAYVVIAMLSFDEPSARLRYARNLALDYLSDQLEAMKDVYSLALTSYALHLSKHTYKDTAYYALEGEAKVQDGRKWWEDSIPMKTHHETIVKSRPLDVEITSYALLTYIERGLTRDAVPIMTWLVGQRNQNGGFQSTQDTAIAMEALAGLAPQLTSSAPKVNVRLIYGARGKNIQVNTNNAMIMQREQLPSDTKTVEVTASGTGIAVVQITYHYNLKVTAPRPDFSLDPQLDITTDPHKLRMTVCAGYTAGNRSNMAVMDVSLPSGYVVDNDLIPGLYDYEGIKLVERKEEGSGVLLYFDSLTPVEVCPTVAAYRVNKVAFQKKSPVTIYDYYDTSRRARQFYKALPATLCDICDLDECDQDSCQEQIIELNRLQQLIEKIGSQDATIVETSSAETLYTSLYLIGIILFNVLLT